MWVEGLPAYVDQVLGVLRRACTPPVHVVEVAGRTLPLGIDAYQGPLMAWLDVPVARAWLGGLLDDPYAYRYKGIVLLALAGLLVYPLLLRTASPAIAALAALLLVTLPVAGVIAISDLQYHVVLLCAVPAILLPLARFVDTRRPGWLAAAAFFAGASLLTRAEVLVWTALALLAWLALERPAWLGDVRRALTARTLLAAGCAFALGAAPTIAMNLLAPQHGLAAFLLGGGTAVPGGLDLAAALAQRLRQFLRFVLLNGFALYEVPPVHVVFLALAAAALATGLVAARRERRWPLALVALAVVLPVSVVANRGPRDIHLLPLMLPIVALVAAMAARLPPRWGAGLLVAGLVANVATGAHVLARWEALRANGADTVATGSCPGCLVQALARHPGASVVHTNMGPYAEALWVSRGHACGRDIHAGTDFDEAVLVALTRPGEKLFVGFPAERERLLVADGRAYERIAQLRATLAQAGVSWWEEGVRDARGRELYRLVVTDATLPPRLTASGGGFNAAQRGRVTGWVTGGGFRNGDHVAIDGVRADTTWGSEALLTFVVDETLLAGRRHRVEVWRAGERGAALELVRP